MDGSTEPPGDRIEAEVWLREGDEQPRLEVRAYLVSVDDGEVRPVSSEDPQYRNADGALVIRTAVEPKPGESIAKLSIAVPYAALKLPNGEHRLGYEVRLRVGGLVAFTQPLPLTKVKIGAENRIELRPRETREQIDVPDRTVSATIANERTLDQIEIRLKSARTQVGESSTQAVVHGGYERDRIHDAHVKSDELRGLENQPWRPANSVLSTDQRLVWYATNRTSTAPKTGTALPQFAAERGPLTYGQCVVNFPIRNHRRGQLEQPGWWGRDPEKHFFIQSLETLAPASFFEKLNHNDVLVFVHGFANSFEDAVLRTGQLSYDVNFSGKAIAFSWPSAGAVPWTAFLTDPKAAEAAYRADEKQALAAAEDLAAFLTQLTAAPEIGRVHVIAHSMGNKVTLQAVYQLAASGAWKSDKKQLGQVILAAPDVGAATFNNLIGYLIDAADRVSYYYSQSDTALAVSQRVNNYEPVGMCPYFERGLDTINADGAGTSFLGHSYYSSSEKMLSDLELLLKYGYEPLKRIPPLGAQSQVYGHAHWSFLPIETTVSTAGGN